ncbi:MAG TPA: YceI family protein [Candidatus Dormibacteraeota bacterium]|jgi:polyisoprenoid-binding protein YceI|nr:YceI family protein [Candidatus Dormibacteraeota bacterium]
MTDTTVQTSLRSGEWDLDAVHSSLEFVARYLMATKVRGRFNEWTATLTTGERPGDAHVEATIQAATITTYNETRDNHMRSADFFEVDKHPALEFRSTSIGDLDDQNRFQIVGDLTARGVTKPVTLDAEFVGTMTDPYGRTKATFSATTELKRDDWGVSWNQALVNGGVLVSKTIKVEIEVQFVLREEKPDQQ